MRYPVEPVSSVGKQFSSGVFEVLEGHPQAHFRLGPLAAPLHRGRARNWEHNKACKWRPLGRLAALRHPEVPCEDSSLARNIGMPQGEEGIGYHVNQQLTPQVLLSLRSSEPSNIHR